MSGSSSSQRSDSENNSSSIGIGGDNSGFLVDGNNNTFNNTDHGAIEAAGRLAGASFETTQNASNNMASVASDGLNLAYNVNDNITSLANNGLSLASSVNNNIVNLADSSIQTNAALVGEFGELSALMLDRSLSSSENTFNNTAQLMDSQSSRNLATALSVTEAGAYQTELGTDLARDLFSMNGEMALQQQQESTDALGNGFKSMMQFADNFSRSDGNELASTNMKTIGLIVGGVVLSVIIFKVVK